MTATNAHSAAVMSTCQPCETKKGRSSRFALRGHLLTRWKAEHISLNQCQRVALGSIGLSGGPYRKPLPGTVCHCDDHETAENEPPVRAHWFRFVERVRGEHEDPAPVDGTQNPADESGSTTTTCPTAA